MGAGMRKAAMLGCTALVASAVASGAQAQPHAPMIDELVVTARKRAEALQDVPTAITAISGGALEKRGLAQTRDLIATTPGLYLSQTGQRQNDEQFYLTIRGVGSSPVVEPSVGVFIDGVYVPSLGWTAEFLDVERVEVLRGPQGALFGRNTEGGAVSIITRKPGQDARGRVAAEVAERDSYRLSAAISGPLAANLYGGAAGFVSTTDGYMRNVTRNEPQDDRDRFGGRLSVRTEIGSDLELTLSGDYLHSEGRFDAYGDPVAGQVITVVDPQAPAAARGSFVRSHPLAGRRYRTYGQDESVVESENYGAGLTAVRDLGPVSITSITGYRRAASDDSYDNDGIPTATSTNAASTRQRVVSEELRVASAGGQRFDYIIGGYAFSERLDQRRLSRLTSGILAGPIAGSGDAFGSVSDNVEIRRKGVALFAQGVYRFTPDLELTVSGRYSYEKVEQDPNLRVRVQIGPTVVNVTNTLSQEKSFEGFSPAGSIAYHINDQVLVYASVSTGFKSGGFTKEVPNTPLQNAALDNERSTNYELGFKGSLLDRRLVLNAALFHTRLKDQQLSTRIELAPGSGVYIPSTLNVGKGHAQGFEVEAVALPFGGLRLTGNVSYTDSEFDDYIASPATAALPAYDRSGQPFPETPKWLASASIEYAFDLGSGLSLTPMLSWQHVGGKLIGQGNAAIPFVRVKSYDVLGVQAALAGDGWSITAFVENLADRYYLLNRFQLQPALSAPGAQSYAKPGSPRRVGVRLGYEF